MLFISKMLFTPLSAWSCSIASSRCCSSTICVCCTLASSTASFRMLLACSLRYSSVDVRVVSWLFSFIFSTSDSFMLSISMSMMVRKSFTGLFFSRSMPSIMCSGPTAVLASLIASSLLNASISDTLGDIWLLFAIFFPFFY